MGIPFYLCRVGFLVSLEPDSWSDLTGGRNSEEGGGKSP